MADLYVPLKERRARGRAGRRDRLVAAKRGRAPAVADAAPAAADGGVAKRPRGGSEDGAAAVDPAAGAGAAAADAMTAAAAAAAAVLAAAAVPVERSSRSLLEEVQEEKRRNELNPNYEQEQRELEEARLLATTTANQTNALTSVADRAEGKVYTESMPSSWRPQRRLREMNEEKRERLRERWHILTEGDDIPPPCKSFKEMRFPTPIIEGLAAKGILRPTPIQVQGIPVALSGRDMVGIAFTGSGKTIVFTLPCVMFALEDEMKLPLAPGEGPVGLILSPSRELARQTFDVCKHFCDHLARGGFPEIRCMLCIGGEAMRDQMAVVRSGVHIVVATTGRLNDHLDKGRLSLSACRYVCLDEGDRLLDLGSDEDVQVSCLLFTVTFHMNLAHNLTRSA